MYLRMLPHKFYFWGRLFSERSFSLYKLNIQIFSDNRMSLAAVPFEYPKVRGFLRLSPEGN